MRINPAPGYLVLKKHSVNKKLGAFQMPVTSGDDAPELGEVLSVGDVITKMPYDAKHIPRVGDVVAYKRYNVYTLKIGIKEYIAVHFNNFLFTVKENERD